MDQFPGKPCARCKPALGWQSLMILQSLMLSSSVLQQCCAAVYWGCLVMAWEWNWHWRAWFLNPVTLQILQWRTEQGLSQKESFLPLMFWSRHLMKHKCLQGLHELMFSRATLLQCGFSSLSTFPCTSLSSVSPQCFEINWYKIAKICLCFSQGTNWLEECYKTISVFHGCWIPLCRRW